MGRFQLRRDLTRAVIDGFALPLGIDPVNLLPPVQGYTLTYTPGEDDDPDSYFFHVVVSHERLKPIVDRAFALLPPEVFAIIEIGSRDAYRRVDVFLGTEPVSLEQFRETWHRFEPLLLEDASIAAGANSEDPFIEIFLDQWKGLAIHVPLAMREEVESMLHEFGLEEVPETWPYEDDDEEFSESSFRPVLEPTNEGNSDLDEILLDLRHEWHLELNIDPESNVDDSGRQLGLTLWHAIVIAEPSDEHRRNTGDGAYVSIWATAGSLGEMEGLIETAIAEYPQWSFGEIFTIDRIAYDERPDELSDLPPRRTRPGVHMVMIDPWQPTS